MAIPLWLQRNLQPSSAILRSTRSIPYHMPPFYAYNSRTPIRGIGPLPRIVQSPRPATIKPLLSEQHQHQHRPGRSFADKMASSRDPTLGNLGKFPREVSKLERRTLSKIHANNPTLFSQVRDMIYDSLFDDTPTIMFDVRLNAAGQLHGHKSTHSLVPIDDSHATRVAAVLNVCYSISCASRALYIEARASFFENVTFTISRPRCPPEHHYSFARLGPAIPSFAKLLGAMNHLVISNESWYQIERCGGCYDYTRPLPEIPVLTASIDLKLEQGILKYNILAQAETICLGAEVEGAAARAFGEDVEAILQINYLQGGMNMEMARAEAVRKVAQRMKEQKQVSRYW